MATTSSTAAPQSSSPTAIVPAQVGFLAIFNPSLGNTDDTLDDQIVYYSSVESQGQSERRSKNRRASRPTDNVSQAERNERLRQIGLAQGMVSFGRNFSGDQVVDTIETEKTRVILHELEPGWWILACIDLTRLPLPAPSKKGRSDDNSGDDKYEYSSREVKPANLLLQDLLRAHSIFLLHHDSSLSALFMRMKRTKFTSTLSRYWDLFLSTWNVLLHGNPVRNAFGGIKIAASGELGIGVGEEERGSGERAVLEDMVGRVDGLVDVVVSKFGEGDPTETEKAEEKKGKSYSSEADWLGTSKEPGSEDGAIFLGVGALSTKSKCDITHWMEDIYTWGENAYGVLESPKSASRRQMRAPPTAGENIRKPSADPPLRVPPSLVHPKRGARSNDNTASRADTPQERPSTETEPLSAAVEQEAGGLMDYLKMGYGKYWSLGGDSATKDSDSQSQGDPNHNRPSLERMPSRGNDSVGHFIVGLTGELEEGWIEDPEERRFAAEHDETNARNMVRTVVVELETEPKTKSESAFTRVLGSHDTDLSSKKRGNVGRRASFDSQDRNKTQRLRVVVYVIKPFIFVFLFSKRTASLEFGGLYRSLHHQLAPLRKSLGNSTTYRPGKPDVGRTAAIYDAVWDAKAMTIHSTIPNIPDPADIYYGSEPPPWSRVEALNTHMQMLGVYKATRADRNELERTCKTSRGWWIVWNRILDRKGEGESVSSGDTERPVSQTPNTSMSTSNKAAASDDTLHSSGMPSSAASSTATDGIQDEVSKEIFLLRKASDHAGHGRSGSLVGSSSGAGAGWADGASRLAQGIGVDTRKYIEGLLSMNM